jgi:pectate lyase
MKAMRSILFLLTVLGLAAAPAAAQSKAQASFDKLKTLAGNWEGTAGGATSKVSYRVISNGSVIEETMKNGTEDTMVTIYHLDGDRLMVTHYCGAGNQPRMVATPDPKSPNVVAFKFLDATNLSSTQEGHMRDLVLTMVDKDHITQQWTWHAQNKEEKMELFKFTRK